ncbi:hypothetical protein Tco_0530069 [Tanacetum coccineum]
MAALQYKDDHNKIAYLGRERGCEDFTDILSYLDHSPLRYALTHAPPVVFDSLVKQFWATAVVRPNAAGSHDLVATIDGREVVVTESLIRTQLHFDDANGIFDMPNSDILEGMRAIGYPTDRALTFLKNHLSPQWRFLVHTLMHCLSPKSGSWNQFPSSIATALLCLSTGRVYNFSRFILEGMIGNVKATKNKFLMYPRFLQMIVAIETADRTPRPTFGFTRKLFANMKFKWEGQPIPLTPPMLAIAAAGDDAADEENAAAHEAAGSTAEAHPEPHSPPVSPVREPTPERQPETEWVVPNPVSPVTDWRPWPSVPAHSPIRDPTPEPASPPTPPAQTFMFEEPLVFGPAPRPAGDVDPDVIESIIFGPQPRPHGYVDPDFVEPIIFGPHPRPDNYLEPEDLDNLFSMEDDTSCVFHGAWDVLTLWKLSWERQRKLWGHLFPLTNCCSSENVEEREEEEVPLRRKRSAYRRARTAFSTPAFEQFQAHLSAGPSVAADKGKAPVPDLDIPAEFLAEDAQAVNASNEEQSSVAPIMVLSHDSVKAMTKQQLIEEYEYICKRLEKDRLLSAQYNLFRPKPAISEPPSKRQRVDRGTSPPSGVPAATTQPADDPDSAGGGTSHPAGSTFGAPVSDSTVPTPAAMDSAGSHHESGVSPFADSADSSSPSNVTTDPIPIDVLFASTSGGINDFFLDSDEEEQIGRSRVAADPDSDDEVLAEIIFRGTSISGDGVVLVDRLPDDEIVDPRVKVETVSDYASSPPRSRRKHRGVRSDDFLWDKPVEDFFSSESESDDDMETYIPPLPYGAFKDWEIVRCPLSTTYYHVYYQENRRQKSFFYLKQLLPHVYREDLLLLRRRMNRYFRLNPDVDVGLDLWRDVNLLCQSLHSDDVEDFWRTQDEWVVSSWKLYPKSSVHVLDLTNGKTVYMFVDKVYPIRATLLERMLRHRLTVPPSYCRDIVVAGSVIQTIQAGLRESYECLASAPIACTARQMVFSSPWLTAKKESGSPLQTALVCNSNPLIATFSNPLMVARLPKTGWYSFSMFLLNEKWLVQEGTALELASPEQTATGKDVSNPLYGCDGLPKTVRVFQFTLDSCSEKLDWLLLVAAALLMLLFWMLLLSAVPTCSCCFIFMRCGFYKVALLVFDAAAYIVSAAPPTQSSNL